MGLKDKKLFLLDMDGTIYIDDKLFEGVAEFLDYVKNKGGRYIFMTNNSSKGAEDYIKKLSRLGIKANRSDFVTSADASIELLNRRRNEKIYIIGTESLKKQFSASGFKVTEEAEEDVSILLCGFDRELTYKKIEDGCKLLARKNVDYYATNPDWVCPVEFGYIPDCGSICYMLEKAAGRSPEFIGKPRPEMAYLSMKKTGFRPKDTLVIGDRLYTDIACGQHAGVETCFVLSGEGTMRDVEKSDIKPTYILENIKELLRRIK